VLKISEVERKRKYHSDYGPRRGDSITQEKLVTWRKSTAFYKKRMKKKGRDAFDYQIQNPSMKAGEKKKRVVKRRRITSPAKTARRLKHASKS